MILKSPLLQGKMNMSGFRVIKNVAMPKKSSKLNLEHIESLMRRPAHKGVRDKSQRLPTD